MSDEERKWQASVLMQAGINSSLMGEKEAALALMTAAKQRFEELKYPVEVSIANGWISGLQHRVAVAAD